MPEIAPAFLISLNFKHQTFIMQELIEKLKTEAGLTDEQAKKALETIKNYVIQKFPMLEGAVNNIFGTE
jgi:hypothetical protein